MIIPESPILKGTAMKYLLVALCVLFPCLALAQAPAGSPPANNGALLGSAEAQQAAATTEAGKYERKSVSFINMLYPLDASTRSMPSEYDKMALARIREALTMERFEAIELTPALTADFIAKANAQGDLTLDEIAKIMDETLVPKILAIVDLKKEMLAQNYTTEAQRNSFYATKAKEFGYTDVTIAKVMNSAYIYLPVAKNYWPRTSFLNFPASRKNKVKVELGVLWYRISTKGEKAQAKLVAKEMTTSSGTAYANNFFWWGEKEFRVDGKKISSGE